MGFLLSKESESESTHVVIDEPEKIILQPRNHKNTLIFCHGLGDTKNGWLDVAEMWAKKLPNTKFILPQAPIQPVSLNAGMPMPSWYDIIGLDLQSSLLAPGIEDTSAFLNKLIEIEIQLLGSAENVIVGGFSQGGGLALFTALNTEYTLGGVLLLSSYLPALPKVSWKLNTETKILQCHGKQDPMVRYEFGQKTLQALQANGYTNTQFLSYANLGHSSCQKEVQDVQKWLITTTKNFTQKENEV